MNNTAINSFSNYLGFAPKRPASQIIPQTPILSQALQTPVTNMQSPQMTTPTVQKPVQPVSTGVLSQGPKLSAPATEAKSLENAPWKFNADKFMENPWTRMGLSLLGNTSDSAIADAAKVYNDATGDIKQKDAVAELNAAHDSGDFNRIAKAKSSALSVGVDPNVITSIDSDNKAKLIGMAATTGNVVDPVTGETTYVQPIPLEEVEKLGGVQNKIVGEQQKIVGDIEVEQAVRKNMGITEQEFKIWKEKYPIESAQKIAEMKMTMEGNEIINNHADARQEDKQLADANKAQANVIREQINVLQTANDKWDQSAQAVDNFKNALSSWNDQDASTFEKVVAEAAKNPDLKGQTVTALFANNSDVLNKLTVIDGAATQLGIAQLRGLGSMAASELAASTATFFNPRAGAAGNNQLFENYYSREQSAYNTRKEQIAAKKAELAQYTPSGSGSGSSGQAIPGSNNAQTTSGWVGFSGLKK